MTSVDKIKPSMDKEMTCGHDLTWRPNGEGRQTNIYMDKPESEEHVEEAVFCLKTLKDESLAPL